MRDEDIYGLGEELARGIMEVVEDAMEENPEIVSRKKELEMYGIRVEIGITLDFFAHKKFPTHLDLNNEMDWKTWLKRYRANWN